MAEEKKRDRPEYELMALEARSAFLQVADEKTWHKEIIFALQAIRSSQYLQKCNPDSIRNSVINIALTGATLNPALQQAFLIPRNIKGKGMMCCLDFSYRGLAKIATESDSVYDIDASAVFEGEEFYYEMGLNPVLIHKPKMDEGKKGKVVAAYAIATLHHGIKKFVVLDREKIERARKSSQAPESPMWKDHYDEGAKKTAVKLLYKLLPQTERMSTAVAVVNEHEGLPPKGQKAADLMERFGSRPGDVDLGDEQEQQSQGGQSADKMPEEERGEKISKLQVQALQGTLKSAKVEESEFLERYKIKMIEDLKVADHQEALQWVLTEANNRR